MSSTTKIYLVSIAIVCTLLSFSQYESFFTPIMYIMWGIYAAGALLPKTSILYSRTIKYIVAIYIIWWFSHLALVLVNVYPENSSMGIMKNVLICGAFYMIGWDDEFSNNDSILSVMRAYLIGATLLAFNLYRQFTELTNIEARVEGKNAASQMLGLAALFGIVLLQEYERRKGFQLFELLAGVFCLFTIFNLHSRTPLVAFFVIFPISIISGHTSISSKILKLTGSLIVVSILIWYLGGLSYLQALFSSSTGETISNFGTDYDTTNALLSGRLNIYDVAIRDFLAHPLFGVGPWAYIDNFVLNLLRTGGIVLAVLVLPLTYGKMFRLYISGIKYRKNSINTLIVLKLSQTIILFYFIVSLMEGYPPLGPNTSVFIFWIIIGMRESLDQR